VDYWTAVTVKDTGKSVDNPAYFYSIMWNSHSEKIRRKGAGVNAGKGYLK